MNTRSTMRLAAAFAATGLAVGALAACSAGGTDDGGDSDGGDVTLTWWHNATSGPLPAVWEEVAAEFEEANPGVTVEQTGYQNEELQRTLIPNALAAGDPPDLFQVWPGGELRDQVENGYLMALDDVIPDTVSSVGATVNPWQVGGETYAVPFTFGVEGFWYNTDLFDQAGVEVPTTFDELIEVVGALREAGITPIAVGAGDGWPAAHWWYQFALKSCSPDALAAAETDFDFSDECFVEAGEQLQDFLGIEPFQDGFLGTPAQQGAGSSAGLVANGEAAMELMGHWNAGVIGGLTADQQVPPFLGWFPVPGIDGAAGDPTAALGGGDGFGCSADAPPECADLLAYIMSDDVQARFAASGSGIPTVPAAQASLEDPNLLMVAEGLSQASFVQLWLDTAFGTTVGNAMNEGIVNLFAGTGSPADIVTKMQDAAATL
ncbi:raffinose/stachyose/melibiose transport system substrate-binding protein [Microbacterium terrae]|uniref:Multiple sugar-binding protein n=1 Tax=Microbacterium terrae TaxID=69369 RepID=A0A0M2HF23_9MICO|nr:extracellular solute-binding protein [Microbacterium terrae]KJL45234.1 Multiple sugar-binding protein precursor [Microbacterium terrae]MBP1078405.1 raffinose/stachyose/melibiose transport system substrate-binding protein [Microbacterium terrae]GLJ99305.1 sugar ABC transporter substrate-binding protein [Microbacterium terrae]